MEVDIFEAERQLSRLIKAAQAGEEVVITHRGKPVARLAPIDTATSAQHRHSTSTPIAPPTCDEGFLQWLNANPLPAHLRRSANEIDATIEDERNAWN